MAPWTDEEKRALVESILAQGPLGKDSEVKNWEVVQNHLRQRGWTERTKAALQGLWSRSKRDLLDKFAGGQQRNDVEVKAEDEGGPALAVPQSDGQRLRAQFQGMSTDDLTLAMCVLSQVMRERQLEKK
ncbi:hypothetical protein GGR56DRAFT_675987 [Xylariaceae sp. FL0804]|nr:hypothetical protein GGR56DRAFT_675987 [Xylariaceae sp. FL0804]